MSLMDDWGGGYDGGAAAAAPAPPPPIDEGGYGGMGAEDDDESGELLDEPDEEEDIFSLEKLSQNFSTYGPIKLAIVRNGVVTIATETGVLIQFQSEGEDITELEMPLRGDCNITGIFADDAGQHYMIAAQAGPEVGVYYLQPGQSRRPKALAKLKGMSVTAVGWDNDNKNDATTKPILLGTREGQFVETCITKGKEEYCKQLYSVGGESGMHAPWPTRITGMDVRRLDRSTFCILAATPTRFYEFNGGPSFEALFGTLGANPPFQEMPGPPDRCGELQLFTARARRERQYAWQTGQGIFSGKMSLATSKSSRGKKSADVVKDQKLVMYPESGHEAGDVPLSIGVTEFHYLVLRGDLLQIVNQLSEDVAYEEAFRMTRLKGDPRALIYDPHRGQQWLYTDRFLFRLQVREEDRHMWELHLQQEQYEDALVFCKTPAQKDAVLTQQAARCFERKNYDAAATFYAKTSMSFEEITLKFVGQGEPEALRTFLINKLENIDQSDSTQMTLICTWLVEIYMDNISHAADDAAEQSVVKDFRMFLQDQRKHLDVPTTYNLLASHGRLDELLFFAELQEDFDRVITHYIQTRQYKEALDTLKKHASSDLYYKFSPALMAHVPYLCVEAWIAARGQVGQFSEPLIDASKLIPALMRYDVKNTEFADRDEMPTEEIGKNQAVRFLLHCIDEGAANQAVCNYLISVLAQQPSEEALLRFLNNKAGGGGGYDVSYALRQCMAAKAYPKERAIVFLYGELGLYEEAVERALGLGDLALALANAERPAGARAAPTGSAGGSAGAPTAAADEESEESTELRKRLWLRIARHVIEQKEDIPAAITLMAQSEGLLKIEDILPFFKGFSRIDDFKDEICNALDSYNKNIEALQQEMHDTTLASERIRRDMANLADRYAFVEPTDVCCLTGGPILAKKFAVFPCVVDGQKCMFYEDALAEEVYRLSPPAVRGRIDTLKAKIAEGRADAEECRAELSEIITADCPRCGSLLVDVVGRPFTGGVEFPI